MSRGRCPLSPDSSPPTSGTTTTVDVGDDTSVNAVNPFQTIERKDVGITLKITPQINAGNTVRLEIEHEISNVSDINIQAASDIITDKRSIRTTVEVDDGQIIVLGGLIPGRCRRHRRVGTDTGKDSAYRRVIQTQIQISRENQPDDLSTTQDRANH